MAGSPTVTVNEVYAALRSSPTSTSPGIDRLPLSIWRVGEDAWAPLLAKLFSAIASEGALPPAFHRGTITPILKAGAMDVTDPVSYRPITLLPTLYRLLARILATRFGAALAPAIGREQTAFLPGRLITDNINFTSLLPSLLAILGISGAIVFVDISKAYDTINRGFLYDVMAALGASKGMIHWARLLLSDTFASVHANGVESHPEESVSGVRQGCNLAPLLYLFIAQALASWLRAQPLLGITVQGVRYVSSHHADDTQVHMGDLSPGALSSLSSALLTFGKASGQRINPAKSSALLVGATPSSPPPTHISGIPVVQDVTALGIPHTHIANTPPPPPPRTRTRSSSRPTPRLPLPPSSVVTTSWHTRLQAVDRRLSSISQLPLSAMGRGLAASTYGLSTLLYQAESLGLSEAPALTTLTSRLVKTVCPGTPARLLCGSPSLGGFGLLPLRAHTKARHAAMANRLLQFLCSPAPSTTSSPSPHPTPHVTSPPWWVALLWLPRVIAAMFITVSSFLSNRHLSPTAILPSPPPFFLPLDFSRPPWVALAESSLRLCCPSLHPAQALLTASFTTPERAAAGLLHPSVQQTHCLPAGPLTSMIVALQALGPLTSTTPPPPSVF